MLHVKTPEEVLALIEHEFDTLAGVETVSLSAAMAAVLGASRISGNTGQCISYCALLGSLLYLCKIIGKEDFRWILGLVGARKRPA
jgi:hypothetical protein